MSSFSPFVLSFLASAVAIAIAIPGAPASAGEPESFDGRHAVPVKVERQKPEREKRPTLRFLRSNRAFIRGQLDRLRTEPLERDASADALDPRQVRHRAMMAAITAADSALAGERTAFDDRDVLARVGDLAEFDDQLGRLDALLAEQRARLSEIEAHFIDAQTTATMFIVRGLPTDASPAAIVIVDDDGAATRVEIGSDAQASLDHDGLMEIYHEFVEPRDQSWRVSWLSSEGVESEPRYVTLRPSVGRLTFVELDLTTWSAGEALVARAWLDAPPDLREAVAEVPAGEPRP